MLAISVETGSSMRSAMASRYLFGFEPKTSFAGLGGLVHPIHTTGTPPQTETQFLALGLSA